MPRSSVLRNCTLAVVVFAATAACTQGESGTHAGTAATDSTRLDVYNAAAIAASMRMVLDSFATSTGIPHAQLTASSLELARRVLDLKGQPDVIVLADPDIFPKLLEPGVTTWHALFARNRIVIAYTAKSSFAATIDSTTWPDILTRPGVEVGRSDPSADPSGYRTLLTWQLAERHYGKPGLYQRLLRNAPEKNMQAREADQVALLQLGEYDYTWTYENLAKAHGLRYVKLPDAIDLGNPADSARYATAKVRVPGKTRTDTVEFTGRAILFAVSVPIGAPHREAAERFVSYLLSDTGRRILRASHFDAMDSARFVGSRFPSGVRASDDSIPVRPRDRP